MVLAVYRSPYFKAPHHLFSNSSTGCFATFRRRALAVSMQGLIYVIGSRQAARHHDLGSAPGRM